MAELDYAFIAEFAKVEGGKLTAIGASYTQMVVSDFPVPHVLAIAGRIRAPEGTRSVPLSLTITPPEPGVQIVFNGDYQADETTIVYDGKIGLVFAVSTVITLTGPGLVEVKVDVDSHPTRRLAFEVRQRL